MLLMPLSTPTTTAADDVNAIVAATGCYQLLLLLLALALLLLLLLFLLLLLLLFLLLALLLLLLPLLMCLHDAQGRQSRHDRRGHD